MLTSEDVLAYYQRLALSARTRSVIDHIRSSDPSRLVGGGKRSVSGRYPSEKMGVTIQFESHTVELAGIYETEYDPDALEFYDQPPQIKLNYASPKGRGMGIWHTADFFVIRKSRAGWEEWKTEEDLEQLSASNPNRYCRNKSGAWICPPGIVLAEDLGLYYRVRSSAEINSTYMRNITFIEDYLRKDSPAISDEHRGYLQSIVMAVPGMPLLELLHIADETIPRDIIFGAIAAGEIYVDLCASPIVEFARTKVYPNRDFALSATVTDAPTASRMLSLRNGSCVIWDTRTWTVANIGQSSISLLSSDQRLTELTISSFESLIRERKVSIIAGNEDPSPSVENLSGLRRASKRDLEVALAKLDAVNAYRRNPSAPTALSKRTLQRWTAEARQAEAGPSIALIGLLPRVSQRGNRTVRFSESNLQSLQTHIEEDYENNISKGMYASWLKLKESCDLQAPSYATFCKACEKRPIYEQTKKRKGERAAYQFEPLYWLLYRDTPRHGDRPFEIGHIDHTKLDIELVSEQTGKNFTRPWLTLMTDAFSRRILACWLSFDPPSYRSCMMVMRDCVKRHNRLPQFIIMDNGPEFRSTYFDALIAAYCRTKKSRPPTKARFGGAIERLFGTVNSQFIHNLRGNTKLTRTARLVTKSLNPKNLAVWTLRELTERLNQYLFEVYDQLEHPALGKARGKHFRGEWKQTACACTDLFNMIGISYFRLCPRRKREQPC